MNIEALADEYLDRLRRGEHPSVDEYVHRYPQLAREIRECFPALRLVELFKPISRDEYADERPNMPVLAPSRLGEYRLVREIGRGGMGVVYEAVQESLGRSVALKLLWPGAWHAPQHRERFLRESRAAARLHHANIVPVFGVGEAEGIQFYAMQYIEGIGLDGVIERLRCLRAEPVPNLATPRNAPRNASELSTQDTEPSAAFSPSSRLVEHRSTEALDGRTDSSDGNSGAGNRIPDAAWLAFFQGCTRRPAALKSRAYWKCVARIGRQAGQALDYAHQHGVLHRDIKPSNLMLDGRGTIWVTDFGLAKTDEQEHLTGIGDVVGTLRYLAPEAFHGRYDRRSDVYSLGLTLYELAALRPAFSDSNRARLVQVVAHELPPRLCAIAPDVPKDLETIIHKAIEREPERRYQTADEMSEDLRRFLDNEPVQARRVTVLRRTVQWCQRHPSLACLLTVLFVLAFVSPIYAIRLRRLATERSNAADAALLAQRDALRQLYMAKRSEARASRFSGRPGQSFASLEALEVARTLPVSLPEDEQKTASIRNELIACLALPDLYLTKQWPSPRALTKLETIHFDNSLSHYVALDEDALSVRRVNGDVEVARLLVEGGVPETARFSPNGELIALCYHQSDHDWVRVWNWRSGEIVLRIPHRIREFAFDFSPDSRLLAAGGDDKSVTLYDLSDGRVDQRFTAASAPFAVRFHPTSDTIAVACEAACCVQIWELGQLQLQRTLSLPTDVYGLCWHPTGDYLAAAEGHRIYFWDLAQTVDSPLRVLQDTTWVVHDLRFHPNGRILYSHCWREGKTRVWDPFRGKLLLSAEGHFSTMSGDGRSMGFRTAKHVGIWKVAAGDICRRPFAYGGSETGVRACDFSPDGRWLAAASLDGVRLWDVGAWREVARLNVGPSADVRFNDSGKSLLVATELELQRWPIQWTDGRPERVGPRQTIAVPNGLSPDQFQQSRDERRLILTLLESPTRRKPDSILVLDSAGARFLKGQEKPRFVSLSQNGALAAAGNWEGNGALIWNAATGEVVRRLKTIGNTVVHFLPDGKRMATATPNEVCIWDTNTWHKEITIPKPGVGFGNAIACALDGRWMAMTGTHSSIWIVDLQKGVVAAQLETNDNPALVLSLSFNPDGTQLAEACLGDGLRVWDLAAIRRHLRPSGLDWDERPIPPEKHYSSAVFRAQVESPLSPPL